MLNTPKTRVAFIKFGGLASGGTERILQVLAANLPSDRYEVDYYYCDAAPYIGSDWKHPDTDSHRKAYMEEHGINLIKVEVAYKDVTNPTHPWIDTNFWELFDESKYDIIQTARAGHPEFPFTHINIKPQIDIITLPGLAERKENVVATVHISQFQADAWVKAGGDANKAYVVFPFMEPPPKVTASLREELQLENKFVFGLHQRPDPGIVSPIPLLAYAEIETEDTAFILMGGGDGYKDQAKSLGLKNFHSLPPTGNTETIHKFLSTLDVYAHGRSDGETFSMSIAEAMSHGIPVVSHAAPAMGHVETIGNAGFVAKSIPEYVSFLNSLKDDRSLLTSLSGKAKARFQAELSLEANMSKILEIYDRVVEQKKLDKMDDEVFWENMWE